MSIVHIQIDEELTPEQITSLVTSIQPIHPTAAVIVPQADETANTATDSAAATGDQVVPTV